MRSMNQICRECRKEHAHESKRSSLGRGPLGRPRPGRIAAGTTTITIGIVGGLGPHAHVEFERLLLAELEARQQGALRDQDFPEWIVSSMTTTPDRTAAVLGEGPSPVPALLRSLSRLAAAGADFAVIPCNTAHAYLAELRARTRLPILDMIELTLAEARARLGGRGRVGLLATTGTYAARVYHDRVDAEHELVTLLDLPNGARLQDELVMSAIYGPLREGRRLGGGIKSGVRGPAVDEPLRRAASLLVDAGAQLVILGCTELPLSLGRDRVGVTPLLDPMQILARHTLARWRWGTLRKPCED